MSLLFWKNPSANCRASFSVPLQIDTSDPLAMERALRIYNGEPLINSVRKAETMRAVLPAKYGGAVVTPLDEEGIPVQRKDGSGLRKNPDSCFLWHPEKGHSAGRAGDDSQCGHSSACTALETIRRAKTELGVATILGVSNISFGLPQQGLSMPLF